MPLITANLVFDYKPEIADDLDDDTLRVLSSLNDRGVLFFKNQIEADIYHDDGYYRRWQVVKTSRMDYLNGTNIFVKQWLGDNCKKRWCACKASQHYAFESKQDALFFKLKWG
jgi:hypothetical protein